MKPGSHLLEIAWPEAANLNFFYTLPSKCSVKHHGWVQHLAKGYDIQTPRLTPTETNCIVQNVNFTHRIGEFYEG